MSSSPSRHLVADDLLDFIDQRPATILSEDLLPAMREQFLAGLEEDPEAVQRVESTRLQIGGEDGAPDVGAALHIPKDRTGTRGAILHIHGGGYITGNPYAVMPTHRKMAMKLDCIILSVDYRLAPEHQYPAAIDDCYAALAWLYCESDALGVDRARIGVMGESAGGGLAAALALMARDRREFPLAFQHLVYPMLDDRTCITADPNPFAGEFIWPPVNNHFAWKALLGVEPGSAGVSPYAAAARADDLAGLPPTFINTGALDLFVDENIDYARRLIRAGVPTEFHIYPGAYHGFHFVETAHATNTERRDTMSALKNALAAKARD